ATLALLARDVNVRQEVHLDGDYAVALTRLAPTALHVEREATRLEATRLRLRHHREQLADEREHAGVGRRIRSRCPTDRRLIDLDDFVDQSGSVDRVVRAWVSGRLVDGLRQRAVENVVDQRRLARTADAGDRGQRAQWDGDVNVLQVVLAGPADHDL